MWLGMKISVSLRRLSLLLNICIKPISTISEVRIEQSCHFVTGEHLCHLRKSLHLILRRSWRYRDLRLLSSLIIGTNTASKLYLFQISICMLFSQIRIGWDQPWSTDLASWLFTLLPGLLNPMATSDSSGTVILVMRGVTLFNELFSYHWLLSIAWESYELMVIVTSQALRMLLPQRAFI